MRGNNKQIRLGLLDNDPLSLVMLSRLFAEQPRIRVIWRSQDPAAVVQHCMNTSTRPDVLLLDIALDGLSGMDICAHIKGFAGSLRCIGITAYSIEAYETEAIAKGMECVLSKENFSTIISTVIDGQDRVSFGPQATKTIDETCALMLSRRELQTLRFYSIGKTTSEIMDILHVSKSTLSSYEHRAIAKLGVHNRIEAVAVCAKRHMLE